MAVSEQTPYQEFIANGVTKSFPLEFDCENQNHLIVTVNGIEPQVGQWSLISGSVVFLIAPANLAKIIIQRNTPFERNASYQTYNNSFRPEPVNRDFDRIWWKLQELGYRDQVIWLALVKEIADRIYGDTHLQNQITILKENVVQNTSDIEQLVSDLSKEIADRITNDQILKDMFLSIIDTAINEGAVNALAITHVASIDQLKTIKNVWNGRTVYVKNDGNYEYDAKLNDWVRLNKNDVTTVESIADLPRTARDGQTVYVKSYHAGLGKGANRNYIYDSSRANENDGCTVINGWVGQAKDLYTVWDFGYHTTDKTISTSAIKSAFSSAVPLSLGSETLDSHNRTQVTCPVNKVVIGQGISVSIISGLTIVAGGSTYIFKDFRIINAEGNLNYGIVVNKYDYVLIDGFKAENTYDAVSIWKANSETSQAIVQNSIAVKAGRIGFTADLGAKNVVFKNLKAFDSRQGYHGELVSSMKLDNCLSIRCGNDAPVPRPPDQPAIYAGGFRFHTFKDVTMLNCRNIDKAGRSIDWLGGGGYSLLLDNCKGINLTTDDVAPNDPITSYTYEDISVINSSDCSFVNQLSKSVITGFVILQNIQSGGNFDFLGSLNTISKFSMNNVSCKRAQAATVQEDAVLSLNNLSTSTSYSCIFTGFAFHDIGDISYNREVGDDSQYPQLGYRFIAKNAKTFFLKSFTSIGRGGGSQISLEDIDSVKFKGGMIGKVASIGSIDAFSGVNFNTLNITHIRKGVAVTNATATDNTATVVNALIESLKKSGYLS